LSFRQWLQEERDSEEPVPNLCLTPSRYVLSAANETDLPILGDVNLNFTVDGHKFRGNVIMDFSEGISKFVRIRPSYPV